MFSLDDLAKLFELTVREDTLAGGLTVSTKGQTIVLTAGQGLASVGGRLVSLPAPPVRDGRTWFVPVDFVSRALAPARELGSSSGNRHASFSPVTCACRASQAVSNRSARSRV